MSPSCGRNNDVPQPLQANRAQTSVPSERNMTAYGFFKGLQMFATIALMIAGGLFVCVWFICSEISTEKQFRQRYGAEWRIEYENVHGSLAEARAKSVMCGVGF